MSGRAALYMLLCLVGLTGTTSCSLAPQEFEYPPIFQIKGRLEDRPAEHQDDDEMLEIGDDPNVNRDLYYVVLSWYVFISNGLTEEPWAIANQTEVIVSESPEFNVALTDQPPYEAFLPAGQGRILQLPADGRLAIGFLTVFRPADSGIAFSWRVDGDQGALCPYEDKLIVWWDGPPLDGEDIGINGGRLNRGLNILDISVDNENQETYELNDASGTLVLPTCGWESTVALRSCGLSGNRGVATYLPGFDGYPMEPPSAPFECFACGSFYEVPNQCSRVLDVLCRECASITVHAYPDEIPEYWPCAQPEDECESGEQFCGLGFRYECIDERWVFQALCTDPCCEDNCMPMDERPSNRVANELNRQRTAEIFTDESSDDDNREADD